MHPVNYLFDEINRKHWGMPLPRHRDHEVIEVPVRPRFHPLQRLVRLP